MHEILPRRRIMERTQTSVFRLPAFVRSFKLTCSIDAVDRADTSKQLVVEEEYSPDLVNWFPAGGFRWIREASRNLNLQPGTTLDSPTSKLSSYLGGSLFPGPMYVRASLTPGTSGLWVDVGLEYMLRSSERSLSPDVPHSAAFVQVVAVKEVTSTDTATTAAFGSSTTGGNSIIATFSWQQSGLTVTSVTDSKSNTYTSGFEYDNEDTLFGAYFHSHSISGGASHTMTCLLSGSASNITLGGLEYSGLAAAGPVDTASASDETSDPDAGSVSCTGNGLVIGQLFTSDNATTISNDNGTERYDIETSPGYGVMDFVDVASANPGWTLGAARPNVRGAVAYDEAGAAGGDGTDFPWAQLDVPRHPTYVPVPYY